MKSGRDRIVDFFKTPGVRIAISRETLSRCCEIAFPTLDLTLAELEKEGILERAPFLSQWRPVRGFVYDGPPSYAKRVEAQIVRQSERDRKYAVEREARDALIEERRADNLLKIAVTKAASKEARERRLAEAAARDERIFVRLAERAERARKKVEAIEARKAARAVERRLIAEAIAKKAREYADGETARLLELSMKEPGRPTLRRDTIEVDGRKFGVTISTPAPVVLAPPPRIKVVSTATSAPDPWAILRARANAKPICLSSGLRQPTEKEKMTGRIERRA